MTVFFDWDNKVTAGAQDGQSDHTGIVEKVETCIIYVAKGNSNDSCHINQYAVEYYEILGYGAPLYQEYPILNNLFLCKINFVIVK